jgi:hypothetical protein
MQQAPGGLGANMQWMPVFTALGLVGSIVFAAGFVLLGGHLLRREGQRQATGGATPESFGASFQR